jgi:hypothetical protein
MFDQMTSQGHPYARFQRALRTGNPILAMDAARDLNHVSLDDALGLCLVLREDADRYQLAAARWLARYHDEVDSVTLAEINELGELLARLPGGSSGAGARRAGSATQLTKHFEQRGLDRCARRVRELVV